ncbi:hypothetical protein [Actinoplanes sp. NPDC049118]|uniref:hypothetical protein n=1 Tax=Actinoplanes sp. NPDC049118 TaxID=3155769 RepID=UPI0033D46E85
MTPTDHIALSALMMSGLAVAIATVAVLYGRRQAIAAEKSIPAPPPEVDWVIENDAPGFRLRNFGIGTATGVRFALPDSGDIDVRVTDGSDEVPRHGSIGFRVTVRWAAGQQLRELPVCWDGQEEPVLVPIPVGSPRRSE